MVGCGGRVWRWGVVVKCGGIGCGGIECGGIRCGGRVKRVAQVEYGGRL